MLDSNIYSKRTNSNKQAVGIVLIGLVLVITFFVGHISALLIYEQEGGGQSLSSELFQRGGDDFGPEDMSVFWEVYEDLQQNYIDKDLPENRVLVEGAIKGMIRALDSKYTTYYTEEEWEAILQGNSGQFEGVGIKLVMGDEYAIVESPIAGSPAEAAGIQADDRIIAVDEEDLAGISLGEVAQKIRGEKGSTVTLTVFRPGTNETLDFDVVRDSIDVDSVEYESVSEGVHKLTISQFTESSFSEFQQQWLDAVAQIEAEDGGEGEKVILDLRNNTGGWVDAARFVLGEFLPNESVILKEVDRDGEEKIVLTNRSGSLQNAQLVVLVNGGSASASEIVAGALQDKGRAKLIGEPTLGKGVEQTVIETSDGGSVHIVFRKWLTPEGRNLSEEEALVPDIEVERSSEDIQNRRDPQLDRALQELR